MINCQPMPPHPQDGTTQVNSPQFIVPLFHPIHPQVVINCCCPNAFLHLRQRANLPEEEDQFLSPPFASTALKMLPAGGWTAVPAVHRPDFWPSCQSYLQSRVCQVGWAQAGATAGQCRLIPSPVSAAFKSCCCQCLDSSFFVTTKLPPLLQNYTQPKSPRGPR